MYMATTLPQKEVVVGAIDDPAYLSGRAAAADIFPGRSSRRRFAASDTASVDSQITGTSARSRSRSTGARVSSQVMPGDSVDVYTSVAGTVRLFRPNVKVLDDSTIPDRPVAETSY